MNNPGKDNCIGKYKNSYFGIILSFLSNTLQYELKGLYKNIENQSKWEQKL
jgi:hypothetical protein